MKNVIFATTVAIFAGVSIASAMDAVKAEPKKEGACAAVRTACEGAGFKEGAHKQGKGLWKDCVDPVVSGTAVEGVTVTQTTEELAACKTQREAMEAHHAEKKADKKAAKKAAAAAPTEATH